MIQPSNTIMLLLISTYVMNTSAFLMSPPLSTTRTSTITTSITQRSIHSNTYPTNTVLFHNNNKNNNKKRVSTKGFGGALKNKKDSGFEYTGSVRPGKLSPRRVVPRDTGITFPDYAKDGIPKAVNPLFPWLIEVKTEEEIGKMRAAGRAAREVLDIAGKLVSQASGVGLTTDEIDAVVHEETIKRGGYPSPLNYHGFPKSCCTSVNEIICHGIPDDRKLQQGELINIDITVYLDGYHGDCSEMFVVGGDDCCDDAGKELIQVTYDCWLSAMNTCKPGNDYKDIGAIIEDYVTDKGFTTVRNFCGHGIGSVFHSTPNILHYRNNEPAGQMAYGHTFTVEPMICEGTNKHVSWPDEWTAATADGKRTAQFEHTLLVTHEGVEPLTGKIEGSSILHFWEENSAIHKGFWMGNTNSK